jgi:hypothetical protein
MLLARALVLVLMAAAVLAFGAYVLTGNPHFRAWGLTILKWTVATGLVFFATLIVSRIL